MKFAILILLVAYCNASPMHGPPHGGNHPPPPPHGGNHPPPPPYDGEYPEPPYDGEYPEPPYDGEYPEPPYDGEYPEPPYDGEYPEPPYDGEYPEPPYDGEPSYDGEYPEPPYDWEPSYDGEYPEPPYDGEPSYDGEYPEPPYERQDLDEPAYGGEYPEPPYGDYMEPPPYGDYMEPPPYGEYPEPPYGDYMEPPTDDEPPMDIGNAIFLGVLAEVFNHEDHCADKCMDQGLLYEGYEKGDFLPLSECVGTCAAKTVAAIADAAKCTPEDVIQNIAEALREVYLTNCSLTEVVIGAGCKPPMDAMSRASQKPSRSHGANRLMSKPPLRRPTRIPASGFQRAFLPPIDKMDDMPSAVPPEVCEFATCAEKAIEDIPEAHYCYGGKPTFVGAAKILMMVTCNMPFPTQA
jgi:hypothetical protein